ncbi:MAG: helix-turn-helix domain-containing protein [bacterium]
MLGYADWYSGGWTRDFLFFMPFMQVLIIGPVVFFYTKSLLNVDFQLTRRDYLHFLPGMLYLFYSMVVFVTDVFIADEFYFYANGRDKDLADWYQATGLVSMSIYLVLSLKYYANYKKLLFDKVSYAESILFKWIQNFMIAFLCILVLRVLFFITNPEWGNFGSQFWHYIAFSAVFYYVAITGYSNVIKQITLQGEKLKVINVFDEELQLMDTTKTDAIEEDYSEWKSQLKDLMLNERLFENPRLALSDVARELKTTTKLISTVVNTSFQMNFNDFVNHYRVEAIKNKFEQGEQNTTTLLGIALDCGFNSKATFNRAFKKHTELSPKEYLKKVT